jgi:hypothetical protein
MGVQILSSYWSIYFPDLYRTLEMQQAITHHFSKGNYANLGNVSTNRKKGKNLKDNSAYTRTLHKLLLSQKLLVLSG